MTRLTAAVFLLLCCMYSWRTGCLALSSESNCLYGRLDFLNCIPHADTSWPGPNEYAFYRTKIRDRIPDCRYQNPNRNSFNEIIRPIDNLGNPNVRLLYSPGYLRNQRYPNNVLVRYNVQCPEGKLPYLFFNELDLPNKQCFGRCEDYVNVTCAACGSSESCGTQPTNNYYSLEQEHFSVTFRSSQLQRDNGFKLSVICFDPLNLPRAGCSNFVGKKKRDLEIHPITLSANEKRMLSDVTNELFNLIPSSNDIDISEIDKVFPEFCKLPPVTGYCRAAFRRWFYNSASGQCEMFLYGGCGGNKNNFKTLEECQQQCSPQPAVVPFALRPRRLVSTAAIRNSVIFEKSCNPVVRAAADSILSIAKRQSASRVGIIRKTIDLE